MSKMSRAELLGRRLVKYYKMTMRLDETGHVMEVKPAGPGVYWSDPIVYPFGTLRPPRAWLDILFKNEYRYTLNEFIRNHAQHWKALRDRLPLLIDAKNLDELDVQLTLAGANHD